MINIVLMLIGFLPLIYGAAFLVDSASSLAYRFKIPNIVIGLTIVAFGTSSPELVVNLFAAVSKNTEIVLGNVLGSNIFNIAVILGVSAIVYPLTVKSNTTWIEIPLCALSAVLLFISGNDILIDHAAASVVSRVDGIVLLLFFVIFLSYNIKLSKSGFAQEEVSIKDYSIVKSIILLFVGFVLLVAGGKIIVEFAIRFARSIGISERIIALTIVSIGTSLPELATSIVAVRKRNVDIAIGNIVGSNIFNVFFILGLSATIFPVGISEASNQDMIINIIISVLLFIFIFTGKGRKLERWEGIIFVVLYCFYILMITIF